MSAPEAGGGRGNAPHHRDADAVAEDITDEELMDEKDGRYAFPHEVLVGAAEKP